MSITNSGFQSVLHYTNQIIFLLTILTLILTSSLNRFLLLLFVYHLLVSCILFRDFDLTSFESISFDSMNFSLLLTLYANKQDMMFLLCFIMLLWFNDSYHFNIKYMFSFIAD